LALSEHIQIVLSERSEKGGADQAVLSPKTWRVADIKTKHELILSGLGWGNLPLHMLEGDLARRRLVRLRPEAWDARGFILPLSLVSMAGRNHGPATRWLGEAITAACRRQPGPRTTRSRFRPRRGSSAKK
jgi:DNA-binding transcriptional LysR family regulator